MAIKISDNLQLNAAKPDFVRQEVTNISDMASLTDSRMPQMYLIYCLEDRNIYLYDKQNESIQTYGRCRIFNGGGGGAEQFQFDELPTASSSLEGKIYQYVGETVVPYANGYFYKCTETSPDTYAWVQLNVQPSGGGGSGVQADWTQDDPTADDYIKNKPDLAAVATSGSYNDLDDTPTLSQVATSGDYDDLNNKPDLATVATSGDYDDLDNKPDLATVATSGDYEDLDNRPSISTVGETGDYNDLTNKPDLSAVAISGDYDDLDNKTTFATVATTGDYDDLDNKPTIPAAQVNVDWNSVSGVTEILNKPTLGTAAAKNSTNAVTQNSTDLVESGAVHTAIANAISSVYKPSGDKTSAELVAALLIADNLGNVYDITTSGTTTSDFVGGAGKTINIGDNVAIVDVGTSQSPSYKFDLLSGFVDTSSLQPKTLSSPITVDGVQQTTVESALSAINSKSSGGSAALANSLTTSMTVGGCTSGTQYAQGTSLETIIRDMVDPVQYPTFTNPSGSLTVSPTGTLLECGATKSVTFTANLNRGTISPAYGTSGYRSGAATEYKMNSESYQSGKTWTKTITESGTLSWKANIKYAEGEQPLDSKGNNYESPLPAGNVDTNTIKYEFVNALWANTSNITTVAKLSLVSKSTKLKEFNFPAATVANPEIFEVPASWTVTAVEYYDDVFTHAWSDCSNEFTITDTTEKDAANVDTAYKKYTCNLGVAMGARKIRIKWS